jgi:hypothetical protein
MGHFVALKFNLGTTKNPSWVSYIFSCNRDMFEDVTPPGWTNPDNPSDGISNEYYTMPADGGAITSYRDQQQNAANTITIPFANFPTNDGANGRYCFPREGFKTEYQIFPLYYNFGQKPDVWDQMTGYTRYTYTDY